MVQRVTEPVTRGGHRACLLAVFSHAAGTEPLYVQDEQIQMPARLESGTRCAGATRPLHTADGRCLPGEG